VFLGDVLAKAGRRADAEAAYVGAMAVPELATWTFAAVLADRIATLDARITLFADADPANDPPVAWTSLDQCAMCHTR
jgi:hypothetical protein